MTTEKKYLNCIITTHAGTTFSNPLKLSEAHLISQIAQEQKSVTVTLVKCDSKTYKTIFG